MARFDRFDICEAYYKFATEYHGGQFSREYRIFGRLNRIGFKPSSAVERGELESENAQEIFDQLVEGNE